MGKRPLIVRTNAQTPIRTKADFFKPIASAVKSCEPQTAPADNVPVEPVAEKPATDNPPREWTIETVPYTELTQKREAPSFAEDSAQRQVLFRATFPHGKTLATAIVSQSDLGSQYYFDYCSEKGLTISIQKHGGSALVVFNFPRKSFIHWSGSKQSMSFCFTKANVSKLNTWCKNDPTFTVAKYSDNKDRIEFRLHIPDKRDGIFYMEEYDSSNDAQDDIVDVPPNLNYATSCTLSLMDFTDALRDCIVANGTVVGLRILDSGLNIQTYSSLSESTPITLITLVCGLRMQQEVEELCFSIVFLELFCRLHKSALNASISLDEKNPLRLQATIKAPAANNPPIALGTVNAYLASCYRE